MSKVAVVYWTGMGNTEMMAEACAEGARAAGAGVGVFRVENFAPSNVANYDGIMFGCPAMGAEVLEESTFEPFFSEAEKLLENKPVALFGSYGWGGGAWMEDWAERTRNDGARLFGNGLAVENTPDDAALEECRALGREFAGGL